MLARRFRRWHNIKTSLGHCLMLAGSSGVINGVDQCGLIRNQSKSNLAVAGRVFQKLDHLTSSGIS